MRKEKRNKQGGITLIALVITIIVLLILAGVAISMLTGENGILKKAISAKEKTEIAGIEEEVNLAVLASYDKTGNINYDELKENLSKIDGITGVPDSITEDSFPLTITINGQEVELSLDENGNISVAATGTTNTTTPEETTTETKEYISTEESYVGYYADIDGDEEPDGIIYADLAVGTTGSGKYGYNDYIITYEIPIVDNLKNYYISQTNYEGDFGTNDVLSPTGTGNERFYIMALSDFSTDDYSTFYWYYLPGLISDYETKTSVDFGSGKENTETMILYWNNEENREEDDMDIWGVIQEEVKNGWFVPSVEEWSAFGGELWIKTNVGSSTVGRSDR